jgi:hypothetical protein
VQDERVRPGPQVAGGLELEPRVERHLLDLAQHPEAAAREDRQRERLAVERDPQVGDELRAERVEVGRLLGAVDRAAPVDVHAPQLAQAEHAREAQVVVDPDAPRRDAHLGLRPHARRHDVRRGDGGEDEQEGGRAAH